MSRELLQIIKELEGEWGGAAPLKEVYQRASRRGFSSADTEKRIEDFKKKGFAYSPTPDTVALAYKLPEDIPVAEEPKPTCDDVERTITKKGFIIKERRNFDNRCVFDFEHPRVKLGQVSLSGQPVFYFRSSVDFDIDRNRLETTVRSRVEGYKELYLDYCCESEDGECYQTCRPHVHVGDKILSVSAVFKQNPLDKFNRLLEELR